MSNIDMQCPLCHADLEIPEEFDGQKVKCPSCSKIITVVDPSVARETSKKTFRVNRGVMQSYEVPSAPMQQKAGLPVPVIIGLVLMMVVTISVSIVAIVMVIKNKGDTSSSGLHAARVVQQDSSRTASNEIKESPFKADEEAIRSCINNLLTEQEKGEKGSAYRVNKKDGLLFIALTAWKVLKVTVLALEGEKAESATAIVRVDSSTSKGQPVRFEWTFFMERSKDDGQWRVGLVLQGTPN